jgi:ubiquinone/menaquinone biosynthesis C-methylase UbiE
MSFSSYFSEQARKPKGLFGRTMMSAIFNIGNARLNELINEAMSIQDNDQIFEIGFGTGKLIHMMASQIKQGLIEGVDFSDTMVSIAEKRNKSHILKGKVNIQKGDFNGIPLKNRHYDKVCSVNTIYFWENPEQTLERIAEILKPGGKLVLGFEDNKRLEQSKFKSKHGIKKAILSTGFSNTFDIKSKRYRSTLLNCVVAIK